MVDLPSPPDHETSSAGRTYWIAALLLAALMGLIFQGSRGIWEPDEGFYATVAAEMLSSGDFLLPRLHGEPFLDKPPLSYWGIAAGMRVRGINEWGARLANSLWFLGTAWIVGLLAANLWGRSAGPRAITRYALMLGPFVAANVLTPDTPLTFCVSLTALATWRWSQADGRAGRLGWALLMGVAVGLGGLAKGPAMLIFCLPLVLYLLATRGWRIALELETWLAALIALGLIASWYYRIGSQVPGAWDYFFDNQVRGRLWSDHYNRNAGAFGAFKVYLPLLLAGSLPWSGAWLVKQVTRLRGALAPRPDGAFGIPFDPRRWARRLAMPPHLFLTLWIGVPCVVLFLAKSRLPLYALPVLPALAVLMGQTKLQLRAAPMLLWILFLVTVKLGAAHFPTYKDSRVFARALTQIGAGPETLIVSLEDKRNGLPFYGFSTFRWLKMWGKDYSYFRKPDAFVDALPRLADRDRRSIFLVKTRHVGTVQSQIEALRGSCARRTTPVVGFSFLDCDPGARVASFQGPAEPPSP